jgi:hypothetical protein
MATEAMKDMTGMQQYPGFIQPFQENLQRSAEARGQVAGLERSMEADRSLAKQRGLTQAGEKFAADVAKAPQRKQLEQVSTQMAEPFIPTRDNAQTLGTIFALVNIAGFAMGAGGKRNAVNAMSAMNGMLEGYQQGRQDLYKREKDIFDTNLKQLKNRYDMLDRQLKDAIETYKTDKQAGIQKAELAYAEAGANFYKQYADKYGLAAAYEFHKQAYDNANKMWTEKNREEDRVERMNRQTRAEERAVRREERAETRFERAIQKATQATAQRRDGKPLPDKQVRDIEGLSSLEDGLLKLKKDWKPEYAQAGLPPLLGGVGAELKQDLERRFGRKQAQEMISWWSRYSRYQAPNRHALFGATLTGNELKNYQTFTAKITDASNTVETMLNDQINYVRSTAGNKIFAAESAGYRVPEIKPRDFEQTYSGGQGAAASAPSAPAQGAARQGQAAPANTEAQARAAFGSYEPDKYEYGVNPATGKFARRRKQ